LAFPAKYTTTIHCRYPKVMVILKLKKIGAKIDSEMLDTPFRNGFVILKKPPYGK
jgi:hypothetical protein